MGEVRKLRQETVLEWCIEVGKDTPITLTEAEKKFEGKGTRSSIASHLTRLCSEGYLNRAGKGIYYLADGRNPPKKSSMAPFDIRTISNDDLCQEVIRRVNQRLLDNYYVGLLVGSLSCAKR